jgi:hypothetical protein
MFESNVVPFETVWETIKISTGGGVGVSSTVGFVVMGFITN